MKKIGLACLIAILCVTIVFAALGMAEEHVHSYGEWHVRNAATCAVAGAKVRMCEDCGNVEVETISTTAHSYGEWHVRNAATCAVAGAKVRMCEDCGNVEVETIQTTAHSYGEWHVRNAATCAVAGVKVRMCEDCGNVEVEEIPATGHKWAVNEEKSVLNAEKTKFTVAFECTECELAYPTVMTKPAKKIVTQEATCDKPEVSTFITDGSLTLNGVKYTFEVKDVETAKALGHKWAVNVAKSEASFDAETKNFTVAIECSECAKAYPMTLTDAGEPTVTQQAICTLPELTTYTCIGYFNGVEYKLVKADVETAKALGHKWAVNVAKSEASFDAETKNFTVAIECSECAKAYPMTLTDAGEPTVTQKASCDKPELTTYTCIGYFNGVEYKLVKADVETGKATGKHTWSKEANEDCEHKCLYCDATKSCEKLPEWPLTEEHYATGKVVASDEKTHTLEIYCQIGGAECGQTKSTIVVPHTWSKEGNEDGEHKCLYCDETRMKGDVNRDGVISNADILMALQMKGGYDWAADMNEDGVITNADILGILQLK